MNEVEAKITVDTTTIHCWLQSFDYGESRYIPSLCLTETKIIELIEYAEKEFAYRMVRDGVYKLKRICRHCER